MGTPSIWIVEDEPDIQALEETALQQAGFSCRGFSKADTFMSTFLREKEKPSLVILDIMLPDRSGLELLSWIRSKSPQTGIVCISARGEEMDRVLGLELGADDYIPKPFSPREMVSRVKAVLRRKDQISLESSVLTWEGIRLDTSRFQTTVDGQEVVLTATEFRLLAILMEKPGQVFTRDMLIERLWNNEKAIMDRTIDAHIKNLREKLGKYGKCLQTFRGVGYKLDHPKSERV
ncbi:response regulator transcription factor [Thermospira aquatica]|uniref:Response regulator transcription factor n=1 Tax=Thermospira aquatica TaxID=2828656 RepID=A0AAX3BG80_9SPIR|nr:response regulator transcription factor [Thermospira aquatica]URA11034.1 response regulator transcription factor [Thermospira aquatica]